MLEQYKRFPVVMFENLIRSIDITCLVMNYKYSGKYYILKIEIKYFTVIVPDKLCHFSLSDGAEREEFTALKGGRSPLQMK